MWPAELSQEQTLLLGMAIWRSSVAFTWWECWFPEGNWMAFPYLHHFQETHEPLQYKYFVGCEKLMFAILLLCLLGFEYSSLFMASEVTSWLSQREWMTTASFLHPICYPTLKSGNFYRKINATHIERLFWSYRPFLMPATCCSLTSLLQTQRLNFQKNNIRDPTEKWHPVTYYIVICRVHCSPHGTPQSVAPSPQSWGTPNACFSVCHTVLRIQNWQFNFKSFPGHNIFKC